jgi:hypothetical protein
MTGTSLAEPIVSDEPPFKEEVEAAVRRYGSVPRGELPGWLRKPDGRHQFELALAVWAHQHPGWDSEPYPVYGDDGRLDHWHGIKPKKPRRSLAGAWEDWSDGRRL